MSDAPRPTLTVVMLAWGDQPLLEDAVAAVLASDGLDVDVVLVDNGCTTDAVERVRRRTGVTLLEPGSNTGFAGGCNLGARTAKGEYLAFVNGDVIVDRPALARMVAALTGDVALATASVRLDDQPDLLNTAGNPVHFSGLSWAGGLGEPASRHTRPRDVASASGATTAVRADRFAELGGFCEPMFAYCEDTELSLRCWQRGWRVVYVPDAVVRHHYEFSRNEQKFYLLERNRLFVVLTLYEARTLAVLAPALVVLELAILLVAVRHGWWRKKVAGWAWLWHHRALVRARRRDVQRARRRPDGELADILTGDFAPGPDAGLAAPAVVRAGSWAYWSVARRLLTGPSETVDRPSPGIPAGSETGGVTRA